MYFCGEKLNRYFAAELLVLSQVNLAHTAAPELMDDAVVPDGFADHLREYYVGETSKSMHVHGSDVNGAQYLSCNHNGVRELLTTYSDITILELP